MNSIEMGGIGMTSQRTRERLVQRLVEQGISNQKVLDVMRMIPRHLFLDEALAHRAYEDTALPIGYSQTLSQPYIVARMTELLLSVITPKRVLEIGTGSGFQTAVLAQLVNRVYSVERIEPLLIKAQQRFRDLKLRNITAELSDGHFGWPRHAPFDGIISCAAPNAIPDELLAQLAPNGALVIPVGGVSQELYLVQRQGDSQEFVEQRIEPVKFVPLLGGLSH